jgi:bifunctional DNase/RNase
MRIWIRVFQRLFRALYRQRVLVLFVLLVAAAAGTYSLYLSRTNLVNEAAAAGQAPVEVTIQSFQPRTGNGTLTLKEKSGSRRISMSLATTETLAIAKERGLNVPADQVPQAYDLVRDVVQQLGGRVDRALIYDANPRDYFAEIVITDAGETRIVKSRPGDAVAVALKSGAPIYVEDKVLDQYGTRS